MAKVGLIGACMLLIATATATAPAADGFAEIARSTSQKFRASYVDLTIVLSMEGEGEAHKMEIEAPGVFLDSSGLIATSSVLFDSDTLTGAQMKIGSVRIKAVGGVETPGKIVLRDPDRGIAFIRPSQPLGAVTPIDFSGSVAVQIGDPVFMLGSLGKLGNRSARILYDRIVGIIEKPRTLYALQGSIVNVGTVAFNEKGEAIGLVTMKAAKRSQSYTNMSLNTYDSILISIVTGKDILEVAGQAPQIKDLKTG